MRSRKPPPRGRNGCLHCSYTYDHLNRVIGESRSTYESGPASSSSPVSEAMTYDADGNLASETNYDGQTVYYKYDHLNQLTQEFWGNQTTPTITYSYDLDGKMTSASDGGVTDMLAYDNGGNLTSDTQSGNGYTATIASTYEADGNRASSALTINGTPDYLNTYGYDALNRETSVTQQGQSGGDAVAPKTVGISYNADGQFNTITSFNGTTQNRYQIVAASVYGYDAAGRLTSLTEEALFYLDVNGVPAASTTIAGYTWSYNDLDLVTSFANSQHASENLNYTYDAAGQLTGVTDANGPTADEAYSYDANGNRTSATTSAGTSPSTTGLRCSKLWPLCRQATCCSLPSGIDLAGTRSRWR
jgi:YD repeat-containing protein